MDRIPVLDVELRKVTCFKPGGNDFSTNQARRPAWPEIPGENTEVYGSVDFPLKSAQIVDFGDKLIGFADVKNAGFSKRSEVEGECKKVGGTGSQKPPP